MNIKIYKNIIFFLLINVLIILIIFPNIFESGVMWHGDNIHVISWSKFIGNKGLSIWSDQIALGVNSYDYIIFLPIYYIFYFLSSFINYELLSKIGLLLPILLLSINSFILLNKIFKNYKFKYPIISIFMILFQFNSTWLNLIFAGFSFNMISLAFLPLFIYFIIEKKYFYAILTSISIPFSTLPGSLIFLALYMLVFIIFIKERVVKKIKYILLVLLLNAWWMIILGISFLSQEKLTNETTINYSNHIINFYSNSLFTQLFLFNVSWDSIIKFGANPILVFFMNYGFTLLSLLLLIINLIFLLYYKKDKIETEYNLFYIIFIFGSLSVLIGIIPTLGIIFKSTDRFLWIPQFINIILVAMFLKKTNSKMRFFILAILGVISIFLIVNFHINHFNVNPYKIPIEYGEVSDQEDFNFSRTLLLPTWRGRLDMEYRPHYKNVNLGSNEPLQWSLYQTLSLFVRFEPETDKYIGVIFNSSKKSYEDYLNNLRITQVIFHKYAIDSTFNNHIDIIKELEENKNWGCLEDEVFIICKRINPIFEIYSDNKLIYERIYSGKYKISIFNLKNSTNLTFFQSFNPSFHIYLNKINKEKSCNISSSLNGISNCKYIPNKFFEGEELSYLYKKPIFDDTHKLVLDYANGWRIDPQYIKDNYSNEYYTENVDGSINIELVVYFKPQSYLYLGIIISLITLFLCIVYLIINGLKQRRKKNIEIY